MKIEMRRLLLLFVSAISMAACDSLFNDEKKGDSASQILSIVPSFVSIGQSGTLQISGTNFTGVTAVDLGEGIRVKEIREATATQIVVAYSVRDKAVPGPRTVTITTAQSAMTNAILFSVGSNHAPSAKFTIDPPVALVKSRIVFDASSSSDKDNNIARYQWDFGDGQTAEGKKVTHTFTRVATFRTQLTVSDSTSTQSVASLNLQVKNGIPPQARFDILPNQGDVITLFKFDASRSTDRDGHIVDYQWNFGDGGQGNGRSTEHRYTTPGKYRVALSVVDNHGLAAADNDFVNVDKTSPAPVASFIVTPETGTTEDNFHFDASSSRDDGRIIAYDWDFGDGARLSGVSVDHRYAREGSYQVKLEVEDDRGQNAFASKNVRVKSSDGGGGGGGGETRCTTPSRKHEPFFFEVLSEDRSSGTIVGRFEQDVSCSDVFYLCGDVRIGGIQPDSNELWIGIICQMYDLGNNTFRIHLVEGKYWVNPGERGTYVWPQYDCNPNIYCR